MYVDGNGNFAFFILTVVIGAINGGLAAGITSYQHGARGWEVVSWSALGSVCRGTDGFGAITSKLLTGIYASPYYTDPFSFSLPYDKLNQMNNISIYEVMNPITVNAGPVNYITRLNHFSPIITLSILFPIMIIINQRLM